MSESDQLRPRAAADRAHRAVRAGRPRDALDLVEPHVGDEALAADHRAQLLVARGNARSDLDDFRGSLGDLEEARALFEQCGQHVDAAKVDMELGITLNRMGRPVEALQRHEAALAAYSQHGGVLDVARCKLNMAQCHAEIGDHARGREILEQARAVFAEHGERRNVLACTFNLALSDWRVGRLSAARDAFEGLAAEYAEQGLSRQCADASDNLASLLHEFGDLERAASLHRDAAEGYRALGLQAQLGVALVGLAHVHGHAGDLDRADEVLDAAAAIATAPGSVAHVTFERSWVAIRRGRAQEALRLLEELEHIDRARGAESALPYRLWVAGAAHAAAGDHATAIDRLERAVTGLRALGVAVPVAEATRELGLVRRAAGHQAEAVSTLRTAADLFAGLGLDHRAAECHDRLPGAA